MQDETFDEFTAPIDDRYLEDYTEGARYRFGEESVDADEIMEFARRYDPQSIHTDPDAAAEGPFGGLIASGWQTAALSLRMLSERFLCTIASMGGLGFSDLKWKKPVMVGDSIGGSATISALRRSKSHPERGIVTLDFDIRNQRGEPVMTMTLANLVECRDPEPAP